MNISAANLTTEEFYSRGVVKIPNAVYSLVYGTIAEVTYVFVMMAMWRLRNTFGVYKIMLNLGRSSGHSDPISTVFLKEWPPFF